MSLAAKSSWAGLLCAFVFCLLLCAAYESASAQAAPPPRSDELVLRDGTPIKLRIKHQISSVNASEGDQVGFDVLEEVKAGKVVVIPRGSTAFATVRDAQKAGRMGRGGRLAIGMDYVVLADGEKAPIRAVEEAIGESYVEDVAGSALIYGGLLAPLFLFREGEDTGLPQGTEITAYVNGSIQLDSTKFASAPSPATSTRVEITSQPSRAQIMVDGTLVGNTPSEIVLAPGSHTITLSKPHCASWSRTLEVSGEKMKVIGILYPTAIKLR